MSASSAPRGKDLLGHDLTAEEARLLAAWGQLKALLDDDLPPCARAAVEEAVAALWQAVNDLALTGERSPA